MSGKALSIQFKTMLKGWIFALPFLRQLFIIRYKLNKCRPWSAGYSFYKFTYIRDVVENQLHYFRQGALPQGYGKGLDERVVEYPWVFSQIKKEQKVILDAGSSLNHWDILSLSCLQEKTIYLTTLFNEGQYRKKNTIYRYEDLREISFPDEHFDAVVCISTLEHIGMDNTQLYGTDEQKKENAPSAYLQAVGELKRVLKNGGALYLTVPYGMYKHHGWFQIFDHKMIKSVVDCFRPERSDVTFFKYVQHQWQFANEQECQNAVFLDIHAGGMPKGSTQAASESVVCLELVK